MHYAFALNRLYGHYRNVAYIHDLLGIGTVKKFTNAQALLVHNNNEIRFYFVGIIYHGGSHIFCGNGFIGAGNAFAFNKLFYLVRVGEKLVLVISIVSTKNTHNANAGTK